MVAFAASGSKVEVRDEFGEEGRVSSAGYVLEKVRPSQITSPRVGRVTVVLPAYNEEESLPHLLARLDVMFEESGLRGEALVVNDGSTDGTAEVVRNYVGQLPLRLLDLQPNRGLAEAIRSGLNVALADSQPGDIVITMDADNSHPPGLIPRMVGLIREGSDMVIASRYHADSRVRGLSAYRKILSSTASLLFRLTVRVPGVRDYTCGFRAYRAELLQAAMERYRHELIQQTGFGCMAELLLKLHKLDPVIHEVPLILRYDFKRGASKMRVAKTARETLFLLLRHKLSWR